MEVFEDLEAQNIKRGIHFGNRMGEGKLLKEVEEGLSENSHKDFTKLSIFLLSLVFLINLFVVYPIYKQNVLPSFSSHVFFLIGTWVNLTGIISAEQFFLFLSIVALAFAPVGIYLFVRKNAQGDDLVAFIASLLFVLPNPLINDGTPIVGAIMRGDGAHGLVFAFAPLLLMGVQNFIASGNFAYGIIPALAVGAVAIISPFACFNLLILYSVVTLADCFMGNLRLKLFRLSFIIGSGFALSAFWYIPHIITRVASLDYVKLSFQKILFTLPVAIPAVPIIGTITFLIFDRRKKLRPILMAMATLIIYFLLYSVSRSLKLAGIFTPDRYEPEFAFAAAFAISVLVVPLIQVGVRHYIIKRQNKVVVALSGVLFALVISGLVLLNMDTFMAVRSNIANSRVNSSINIGISSFPRNAKFDDSVSLISTAISAATLVFLFSALITKPSFFKLKDEKKYSATSSS